MNKNNQTPKNNNQTITNDQKTITKQSCLDIGYWLLKFVCILSLGYWNFSAVPASAQPVQLGTYYPSPFGNYDHLRLVPRAELAEPCIPGILYVNADDGNILEVCKSDNTWGAVAGGYWNKTGNTLHPIDIADKVAIGTDTAEFRLTLDKDAATPDGGILVKGTFGSGTDLATSGAGTRLFWYPKRAAFRAGSVTGIQWDHTVANPKIGTYSVAMGYDTRANAGGAVSLGYNTRVPGSYAVAMGYDLDAVGDKSVAMGENLTANGIAAVSIGNQASASGIAACALGGCTTASGNSATAMGYYATAQAYASLVLGQYNVISGTTNSWVFTDPLFVLGNGTGSAARSNAFTVLKNGKVGIGVPNPTTSPLNFKLTLDQGATLPDGGILAFGTYDPPPPNPALTTLTTTGAGTRLIWYPRLAAFRAGGVSGAQWDETNIGLDSIAFGYNNTAKKSSIVMGYNNTATESHAIAMGSTNIASAESAVAMGERVTASGQAATAMGYRTTAGGAASVAIGDGTTASGDQAVALGRQTTAKAHASLAIGLCNVTEVGENQTGWTDTDPAFLIGNGFGSDDYVVGCMSTSNALKVTKKGDTTIGGVLDAGKGLIVEMRTTDPALPANGRVWLCTDAGDALPCNGL